jgi:molybdenum cofactor cytidylyltransferase
MMRGRARRRRRKSPSISEPVHPHSDRTRLDMISAVVLAVGHSAEQKAFSPLDNKPLLQRVLENALASRLDEIVCVTRDLKAVRREVKLSDRRLCWLVNSVNDHRESALVAAGLWASDPRSDGVMFLDGGGMPVHQELIDLLIARFEQSTAWIVAPGWAGQPRSPALFRRDLFPELLSLAGNGGERSLLERHAAKTALVEWLEGSFPREAAGKKSRRRLKPSP